MIMDQLIEPTYNILFSLAKFYDMSKYSILVNFNSNHKVKTQSYYIISDGSKNFNVKFMVNLILRAEVLITTDSPIRNSRSWMHIIERMASLGRVCPLIQFLVVVYNHLSFNSSNHKIFNDVSSSGTVKDENIASSPILKPTKDLNHHNIDFNVSSDFNNSVVI